MNTCQGVCEMLDALDEAETKLPLPWITKVVIIKIGVFKQLFWAIWNF